MKKIGKLLLLAAGVGCLVIPNANQAQSAILKKPAPVVFNQYDKLVQGLNVTNSTEVTFDHPSMFNSKSADFQSACEVRHIPDTNSDYFSSASADECSKMYATKFNGNIELGLDAPSVSLNIDAKFKKSDMTQKFESKEESYEYFYWLAQKYIVNIDWFSPTIQNAFSDRFLRELGSMETLLDAGKFLDTFGTHVFSNYILGGKMEITKYFCKDANYELTSTEKDLAVGLNTIVSIGKAEGKANASVDFSKFETDSNKNEHIYSKMTYHSYGGTNCTALKAEDLFQFKPQFGNGVSSGFLYEDWTRQFTDNNDAQVIPITFNGEVPIWDIIDNQKYSNQITLLKKAFDIMLYKNYAAGCEDYELDCGYVNSITYTDAGSDVTLKPSSKVMYLPEDTKVTVNLSDLITTKYQAEEYKLQVSNDMFATIKDNVITTKKASNNVPFNIELYIKNDLVLKLPVVIKQSGFNGGYGTHIQPYLINSKEAFVDFLNDFENSEGITYKLTSDIDLNGEVVAPGGYSTGAAFKGVIDGANFRIKNGNIICKTFSNNLYDSGLIARNEGTIQNVILDNMKSYIDGVVASTSNVSINHGILVGNNKGTISNCRIYNSTLRSASKVVNGAASYSMGAIAGTSSGQINKTAVNNNKIANTIIKDSKVKSYTGSIVGLLEGGSLVYSYAMKNSIKAFDLASITNHVGGLLGYAKKLSFKISDDTEVSRDALIENCIAGDNQLKDSEKFGYIAGACVNTTINKCFHNGLDNKSVDNGEFNGCTQIESLKLSNISSLEIKNEYMEKDGIIILNIHNAD